MLLGILEVLRKKYRSHEHKHRVGSSCSPCPLKTVCLGGVFESKFLNSKIIVAGNFMCSKIHYHINVWNSNTFFRNVGGNDDSWFTIGRLYKMRLYNPSTIIINNIGSFYEQFFVVPPSEDQHGSGNISASGPSFARTSAILSSISRFPGTKKRMFFPSLYCVTIDSM